MDLRIVVLTTLVLLAVVVAAPEVPVLERAAPVGAAAASHPCSIDTGCTGHGNCETNPKFC